jgi:alkyldihydroxyacetonephosphate synthase
MTPWIRWDTLSTPTEPAWRWLAQSLGMPALLATPTRPRGELQVPPSRLTEPAKQKLADLLGARLRLDDETRLAHAGTSDAAGLLRLRGGELSHLPDAVFRPVSEDEVLAVLKICTETGVAIGNPASKHPAFAVFDFSDLADIFSVDAVSGLAQVQAGIDSAELTRQLAARGMAFDAPEFSNLGGWIAQGIGTASVMDARIATPNGFLTRNLLADSSPHFGIVTSATLRVRAIPASTAHLHMMFPDFASGLAAMREVRRESAGHIDVRLSDADETRFHRNLAVMDRRQTLMQRVTDIVRGLHGRSENGAAFNVSFSGSAADVEISRKRFTTLARRLGASPYENADVPDYRALLLDRGVTADRIRASATWSELPTLYTALRAALDQAMRRHAPRPGAHGLVLTQITGARHDGADLTCTFLYPRQLNGDVTQAESVRRVALDVLARKKDASDAVTRNAIRAVLDPAGILAQAED